MNELDNSRQPANKVFQHDICALGEILIDFTPAGIGPQGNPCFERNPGGAPANVLACLSRYGRNTALLAKVGADMFGDYLLQLLDDLGIDKRGVSQDYATRTTLAFVQLDSKGERSFSFYRNPGADIMLEPDDLDFDMIAHSRIFHCGSLSLTNEPAASATWAAIGKAAKSGCVISYDPNFRPALWPDLEVARQKMVGPLGNTDILKLSEEELVFLTGLTDLETGSAKILEEWKIPVILITQGERGVFYRIGAKTAHRPAYFGLEVVDTTGAGDIFFATFLYCLLRESDGGQLISEIITNLQPAAIEPMIDFAAAAAGLCATKRGAIPAIPDLSAVRALVIQSGKALNY